MSWLGIAPIEDVKQQKNDEQQALNSIELSKSYMLYRSNWESKSM